MGIMLTEPASITSANYKLLPAGQFHRTRNGKVKAGVVHVTAGLQDLGLVGTDESAEGTNRWALTSGVVASWCRISDTDGVERCLPSTFVAYQAKGYNTHTVGNEIANLDARWDNKPAEWVKWTIWYAALAWADLAVEYNLPLRRATQAELDRAIATDGAPVGFIDHSRLSVNRRDPGATFPWALFFKYLKAIIAGATHPDRLTPPAPTTSTPSSSSTPVQEDAMLVKIADNPAVFVTNGQGCRWLPNPTALADFHAARKAAGLPVAKVQEVPTQARLVAAFGPISGTLPAGVKA